MNSRAKSVLGAIVVSTVATACVVVAALTGPPFKNLLPTLSDPSALLGLLTITVPVSLFFGVVGGAIGGLVAWRAKQRLETSNFLFRALWSLRWGAFLGFLIPGTAILISSLTSPKGGFAWSTAVFFSTVGAVVGSVSGGIVSGFCFRFREQSARVEVAQ